MKKIRADEQVYAELNGQATVVWDETVQMWYAHATSARGQIHRKWFARQESAQKWAKSWEKRK